MLFHRHTTRTLPRETSPDACTGTRHLSRPLTSMLLAEGSLTGTAARRCAHSIQKGRRPGGAAHHPERCAPGGQDAGGAGRRSMDPSWCPPHRSGRRATGIMALSHRARSAATMPLRPATPHYPQPGRTRQDASRARVPRVGAGRRAVPHRRRRGGATKLGTQIAEVLTLGAAHGTEPLLAALERAVTFGRWRADDVRSILAAGGHAPRPTSAGQALMLTFAVGTDQVAGRLPDRHDAERAEVSGPPRLRRRCRRTERGPEAVEDGRDASAGLRAAGD